MAYTKNDYRRDLKVMAEADRAKVQDLARNGDSQALRQAKQDLRDTQAEQRRLNS